VELELETKTGPLTCTLRNTTGGDRLRQEEVCKQGSLPRGGKRWRPHSWCLIIHSTLLLMSSQPDSPVCQRYAAQPRERGTGAVE
jgi:hypothetical protein